MAKEIIVPDSAYTEQRISLLNQTFSIQFRFNDRDEAWHIDIFDINENPIISGNKLLPFVNVTGQYCFDEFAGGNLWCFSKTTSGTPMGRDNFGVGKEYGLFFLSNEEEINLGLT